MLARTESPASRHALWLALLFLAACQPVTLSQGAWSASALAVDSTDAYWIAESETLSAVLKVPLQGGATTTFANAPSVASTTIAVDARNVYWTTNTGAIVMAPKSGAAPVTIVSSGPQPGTIGGGSSITIDSGGLTPGAIAIDSQFIYWIGSVTDMDHGNIVLGLDNPYGGSFTLEGGGVTTAPIPFDASDSDVQMALNALPAIGPMGVFCNGDTLESLFGVDINFTGTLVPLTGDGSGLIGPDTTVSLVTEYAADGLVLKTPLGGGAITTLASHIEANALALDNDNIYFGSGSGYDGPGGGPYTMLKVPKAGGEPITIAAGLFSTAWAITVNNTHVYWADGDGEIVKAPISGGPAVVLTSATSGYLQQIAVDSDTVYWADAMGSVGTAPINGGSVVTLAPDATYGAFGLALSGGALYWTESTLSTTRPASGRLLKLAPK